MSEEQFIEKMNDVLKSLEDANKESDKFTSPKIIGVDIPVFYDIKEMALAFEKKEYWFNEYKILLTQKYPTKVPWVLSNLKDIREKTIESIDSLNKGE